MCGLGGIFHYDESPIDRDRFDMLHREIASRGPDGHGRWSNPRGFIGLTHSRLAILDLTDAGAQPMHFGDLTIVFNGEIYNHAELRKRLENDGDRFQSHCDTEVILHLWRKHRERMLPLLRGMFAIAIWDEGNQTLFAARDLHGIKPLYYVDDGRRFAFASLVQSLARAGLSQGVESAAAAAGFLLTGSVPEPITMYDDVRALEPGTFMTVAVRSKPRITRWGSIPEILAASPAPNAGAVPEQFREAVLDSVRHHLVSDVPIAAFLSSGIDSSALVASIRDLGISVEALTLAFDEFRDTPDDEAPLAAETARMLGIRHQIVRISRNDFLAGLDRFLLVMDQPTIDGVNSYLVSKAASMAGFKVALSGLGADELLGGYPSFRTVPRIAAATQAAAIFGSIASLPRSIFAGAPIDARWKKLAAVPSVRGSWALAYKLQRQLFLEEELVTMLGVESTREGLATLGYEDRIVAATTPDPIESFRRVSAAESCLYMRNQLLRDTDWASMSHPVEVRVPFVDKTLLETIAPWLHGGGSKKRWLLESLRSPLPPGLATRRKTGFFVPVWKWIEKDLGDEGIRGWAKFVFARKFPQLSSRR